MAPTDRPLVWLSGEVKTPPFSVESRLEAGMLLRRLQRGEALTLPHSRPMPSIGKRCYELRIVDETSSWRILYRLNPDAIVILGVFKKTTRTTPKRIIDQAKRRLVLYEAALRED